MMSGLQKQIAKASESHEDEIVAVMKEVRNLLLEKPERESIIKADFNEDDHPRDEAGKFTSGGGSSDTSDSSGGGGTSGRGGRYNTNKIVGKTTSTGVEVKTVSHHAEQRMHQRHISANKVAKVLESNDSTITNGHDGKTLYFKDNVRVVFDDSSGTVVTCIRRNKP